MPDFTPFWISIKVALISTVIVTIIGVLISKWLYERKGIIARILESIIVLPIVLPLLLWVLSYLSSSRLIA